MKVEERRRTFETVIAALVALVALCSALGAWVLLPYRMNAAEAAIKQVQIDRQNDHDILLRLDARTEEIFRAVRSRQEGNKP